MTAPTSKTRPATAGYTTLWGTTRELAQQFNTRGNRQLYWYMQPRPPRAGASAPRHAGDMEPYLLERRIPDLFGIPQVLPDDVSVLPDSEALG